MSHYLTSTCVLAKVMSDQVKLFRIDLNKVVGILFNIFCFNLQNEIANSNLGQRSSTPKIVRNSNASNNDQHRQPKSAPPECTSSMSSQQQQQSISNIQNLDHHEHIPNIHFQHLAGSHTGGHTGSHSNDNIQNVDYITTPQLSQNFSPNPNTYDIGSMPTVIQQRMTSNTAVHSLSSPHARIDQNASSCAINNFYLHNMAANESNTSRTAGSASTPTNSSSESIPISGPSGSGSDRQEQVAQTNSDGSTSNNNGTTTLAGNPCSLSKLQQLTNGLDLHCNTSPGGQVNLTPPHNSVSHNSMTPPPHLLVAQNRNISTPPNMLQTQMAPLQYHKYYPGNMNISPMATAQNSNRSGRNTASTPLQHIASTAATTGSRASNVHIGHNLMTPYGAINSYRMSAQQTTGSAGYSGPSEYPNSQIPMQMGVMNMQAPYQDACAIQRAAQQNPVYSSYSPYISLNGPMRR